MDGRRTAVLHSPMSDPLLDHALSKSTGCPSNQDIFPFQSVSINLRVQIERGGPCWRRQERHWVGMLNSSLGELVAVGPLSGDAFVADWEEVSISTL